MKNDVQIKTPKTQWVRAHRLPNYSEICSAVSAVAGEGEQVTAEQVGKTRQDFCYDEIRLVVLRGTEILYTLNREDGGLDVEFLGTYSK